jgi:hypothetical protein
MEWLAMKKVAEATVIAIAATRETMSKGEKENFASATAPKRSVAATHGAISKRRTFCEARRITLYRVIS